MMRSAAVSCVVLPWDSQFFGVRIGRMTGDHLGPADVAAALRWAEDQGIECLYALAEATDTPALRALEAAGFNFIDIRLTLDRDISVPEPQAPPVPVRLATLEDRGALATLARASHHNTRFYEDGRFDRARCDELYAVWIEKALVEPDAMVLVPELDQRPAGYLSLHRMSGPGAHIGLIAVAHDLQGQGVGEALMAEGFARLSRSGASRVSVVTQGRNAQAVRFYEKCGFRSRSCQFWYHRWFER